MSRLEGFPAFDENPILCSDPRSDHDCSGRGQSEGARTGDEEDCHGVDEGLADVVAGRDGDGISTAGGVVTLGREEGGGSREVEGGRKVWLDS